ncbi:MAG TPA: hypothetical protein VIZ30_07270 [Pseudomonadales bacterium]
MSTQPPDTPENAADVTANGELSPRERLSQSRRRISVWLEEGSATDGQTRSPRDDPHPVAVILKDVIGEWWRRHPLSTSVNVTAEAARNALVPFAHRHPIAVLGIAAVAGAVLVRSRAWRWVVKPAVIAGLASQVFARVVSQLQSDADAQRAPRHDRATSRSGPVAPPTGRAR